MDLKSLHSHLNSDFADFDGQGYGYTFYSRFDSLIGVRSGIERQPQGHFQEYINNNYSITVSFGIGTAATVLDTIAAATKQLQDTGSVRDPERT